MLPTNQLTEVRSDVEGALLGWLPPPPTHALSVRYLVDPYRLAELQGKAILPMQWQATRESIFGPTYRYLVPTPTILELVVAEWAVLSVTGDGGLEWRYAIPRTCLAFVCPVHLYDTLRAVRAFLPVK